MTRQEIGPKLKSAIATAFFYSAQGYARKPLSVDVDVREHSMCVSVSTPTFATARLFVTPDIPAIKRAAISVYEDSEILRGITA